MSAARLQSFVRSSQKDLRLSSAAIGQLNAYLAFIVVDFYNYTDTVMRIEKFFIFHFFLLLNCIVYGQNTPLNNKFKIDGQIASRDTGRIFFGTLMAQKCPTNSNADLRKSYLWASNLCSKL